MRNIGDHLKATWVGVVDFFKEIFGIGSVERVESAKITSTRLKALAKPDYLEEKPKGPPPPMTPFEEAQAEILSKNDNLVALDKLGVPAPDSVQPKPGRSRGTAEMSHFRLAAYVASLTPEERAAQEKAIKESALKPEDENEHGSANP